MRLEQLEFLVSVADAGSITRASSNLFLTQPTLSTSINNLEKELGFSVFQRSQKGVVLTKAGDQVYQDARRILETIQSWGGLLPGEEPVAGSLTVAYTPANSGFLTQVAEQSSIRYPGLHLTFYECVASSLFDALQSGDYHLGISGIIPAREEKYRAEAARCGWNLELLCEDSFHIMMSTQNPLSQKDRLDQADLEDLPLAMLPLPFETVVHTYFKPFFPKEYPSRIPDRNSILELVAQDRAVSILPALSVQGSYYVRENLVRPMLLRDFNLPIRFYLLSRARTRPSNTEQAVMDIIRSAYRLN